MVERDVAETERRLAALLDRVERTGAILLLDEGDDLFGTRLEASDDDRPMTRSQLAHVVRGLLARGPARVVVTLHPDAWRRALQARPPRPVPVWVYRVPRE